MKFERSGASRIRLDHLPCRSRFRANRFTISRPKQESVRPAIRVATMLSSIAIVARGRVRVLTCKK